MIPRLAVLLSAASCLIAGTTVPASAAPPIIGGEHARRGELPWQVSIQEAWQTDPLQAHRCGGSIYAARWIVTAAHCVDDVTADQLLVAAGEVKLKPGIRRYRVGRIVIHPDYEAGTRVDPPLHDIALLELDESIRLTRHRRAIAPIRKDEEALLDREANLTVSGWGRTQPKLPETVEQLQKLDVPLVPRERCNRPEAHAGSVTEEMLCAGFSAGGADSCVGDSGGPLALVRSRRSRLVGVVSWGEGCAERNKVGVYARVSSYRDWIVQTAR